MPKVKLEPELAPIYDPSNYVIDPYGERITLAEYNEYYNEEIQDEDFDEDNHDYYNDDIGFEDPLYEEFDDYESDEQGLDVEVIEGFSYSTDSTDSTDSSDFTNLSLVTE